MSILRLTGDDREVSCKSSCWSRGQKPWPQVGSNSTRALAPSRLCMLWNVLARRRTPVSETPGPGARTHLADLGQLRFQLVALRNQGVQVRGGGHMSPISVIYCQTHP